MTLVIDKPVVGAAREDNSVMVGHSVPAGHVNTSATTTVPEAFEILRLDAELELNKIEQKELRARFIALLPIATAEQFAVVKDAARSESELPEGMKVNQDFKLSTEQEQVLSDIRKDRRDYLTANRDTIMSGLLADQAQHLTSFKVRVGTKKTTTTARFEKSIVSASQKKGLIAHLRSLTANE